MNKSTELVFRGSSRLGNILILLLFVSSMLFSTRVSGQLVAVFENDDDFLRIRDNRYHSVFILETDKDSYNGVVSAGGSMPETFTLITKKIRKNKYQCSILFTHPTEPSYVKKILLALGIEQLKVNNKLFELPEYDPVVE